MSKTNTKPKPAKTVDPKVASLEKKLAAEKTKLADEKKRSQEQKKLLQEEIRNAKLEARLKLNAEKKRIKEQEKLDKDAAKFRANEENKRIRDKAKRDVVEQKQIHADEQKKLKEEHKSQLKEEQERLKAEQKIREDTEKENQRILSRRAKIEDELAKKDQQILNYKDKLKEKNKELADVIDEQKRIKRENAKQEKEDRPSYKDLKKQVDEEINQKRFFREQMNHRLKKISKESESGMARMGAKSLMGAGNFISDKLNDFADSIPGLKQANTARKFIKTNMADAREAKFKRMSKDRMSELRGESKPKKDFSDFRGNSDKGKEDEKTKEKDNRIASYFQEMISILKSIRLSQLLNTFANIGGGFIKALAGAVGGAFETVFSKLGIKKILGGLAAALGAKKLADTLSGGAPDIDIDVDSPDKEKKPRRKPSAKAPKPTRPPAPGPAPKGKGGFFKKMKGRVAGALGKVTTKGAAMTLAKVGARFLGPVGALMTMYEVADHFGLVDEANDIFDDAMKDWFGDGEDTPEKQEQRMEQAEKFNSNAGPYGQANPNATPYKYPGAYDPAMAAKHAPKPAPTPEPVTLESVDKQLETARTRLIEVERKMKEMNLIKTEQAAAKNAAGAVNANVNNVSTVTNNSTSVIQFNNSEYQTSHQKGTQVIR